MPVLTVASVKKYAAQTKRREIPDAKATGLYLVIQPKRSGAKSWALRFRRPDGRPAKMWLGRVEFTDRETEDDPVIGRGLRMFLVGDDTSTVLEWRKVIFDLQPEPPAEEKPEGEAELS